MIFGVGNKAAVAIYVNTLAFIYNRYNLDIVSEMIRLSMDF